MEVMCIMKLHFHCHSLRSSSQHHEQLSTRIRGLSSVYHHIHVHIDSLLCVPPAVMMIFLGLKNGSPI